MSFSSLVKLTLAAAIFFWLAFWNVPSPQELERAMAGWEALN